MKKIISLLIVLGTIIFNLYLYRNEPTILADPNDNVFQYSLVYRTNWVWENYGCPFSLECIPNLVDHNVTYWAEGYSLPFYYSHLPQIAIVATHKLIIYPLTSIISPMSLYQYYNLTKYLLLCLFPLPVFLALRFAGFALIPSALTAFFASHYSTDGLYGIDPPSFLWRGYGLTSQLYAMYFMPLAFAFTYRALKNLSPIRILKFYIPNSIFSIFFLVLTTAGHLGIGIITILASFPFIFLDINKKNLSQRFKKYLLIVASMIFLLSYWIIPILLNNNYHIVSFWDPIWKFNSYGAYEVIRQYLNGEIFDWGRYPYITFAVTVGFFTLLLKSNFNVFALSFALMFVFYFGRTTFGGLIDLIPGMKDFHQHRFIVGVQLTSLFLLPAFFETVFAAFKKIKYTSKFFAYTPIILSVLIITLLSYFIVAQTVKYNSLNHKWIGEANTAYKYYEQDFYKILDYLKNKPKGRIYAGRPGNWGNDFRLGSTQIYMLLSVLGYDMTQWLPETWSMMSENDQNFDERSIHDYDLLNARYIILPALADGQKREFKITESAKFLTRSGPFELYEVATTGWFDVVESPMFVSSDKTNFLNLVYLWHRGFPRTWKMHPLISVDKNPSIPQGLQRNIKMVNEVSYLEHHTSKVIRSIFSDFPFLFPQSTPSGQIKTENISRQTYSATIEVPASCNNCMIMFKMSYHPNWQVKIDGTPVEKYAVFPMYVAAPAERGTHTIEITHKPNNLKVLLIILEIILIPVIFIYRRKIYKILN